MDGGVVPSNQFKPIMTNFTTTQKINTRGDQQFDIYRDGTLVAFCFEEQDVARIIDEMTRFPVETRGNRFD